MTDKDLFGTTASNHAAPRRLPGKYRLLWLEESVNVGAGARSEWQTAHTERYVGSSISAKSIRWFWWALLTGLVIIAARVSYLQLWEGSRLRLLAEGNRLRLVPIPAERGIIYDRFGKELVQNVPSFTLSIIPQDLPRQEPARSAVIRRAAELAGMEYQELAEFLTKYGATGFQSLLIKENLDHAIALQLYTAHSNLPGVVIDTGTKRHYVQTLDKAAATSTMSLSHVLGYLGKLNDADIAALKNKGYLLSDVIGRTGIEKIYEPWLRGTPGRKKIEVDALGREQNILAIEPPQSGSNVRLTIDAEAQERLEALLKAKLTQLGQRRGAAIALNPQTGGIIALVSLPSFDNNAFSGGIASSTYRLYSTDVDQPLFNRSIAGTYPPGSTIKLVVAAAALSEKIITPATTVASTGGITVGGKLFRDWLAGGHGLTSVTKAIAWSVNTFFYYAGGGYGDFRGLGVDTLVKYLQQFGIGEKTGVDLPGEHSGLLPSKEWKLLKKQEPWYVGDTYNLSIGQGDVLATPLQVARWTAQVANNGQKIQPHILEMVENQEGETILTPTTTLEKIVSVSTADVGIVRQGMRDCINYGSCKLLQTLGFAAGGKTGTAQWRSDRATHAWFTSFAPFDRPQIVVTVLVEEGGEGASAAMPVARDFLAWWGKKYLTGQ